MSRVGINYSLKQEHYVEFDLDNEDELRQLNDLLGTNYSAEKLASEISEGELDLANLPLSFDQESTLQEFAASDSSWVGTGDVEIEYAEVYE